MSDSTPPATDHPPASDKPPAYSPPPESPPPHSADPPPSTGALPNGTGGVFGADPELVSKGAAHIALISGMVGDAQKQSQLVVVEPQGNGPIATALREKFVPAKQDSDTFLGGLSNLVGGESQKTAALARLLPRVSEATTDAARGSSPRGG